MGPSCPDFNQVSPDGELILSAVLSVQESGMFWLYSNQYRTSVNLSQ